MKKTVIAIWGAPGKGKSSSIKEIVKRLPGRFPLASIDILIPGADIQAIIKIGAVTIGVESAGDPGSRLPKSLKLFVKEGCDIIICATRTRGTTVQYVEALQPQFQIVWTSNYYSLDKPIEGSNRYFADHILFMLDEIMAGRY